jgi:hypothetical protein
VQRDLLKHLDGPLIVIMVIAGPASGRTAASCCSAPNLRSLEKTEPKEIVLAASLKGGVRDARPTIGGGAQGEIHRRSL